MMPRIRVRCWVCGNQLTTPNPIDARTWTTQHTHTPIEWEAAAIIRRAVQDLTEEHPA